MRAPTIGAHTAAIEAFEVRWLEGNGSRRAFAKVRLGTGVIHRVRVVQQPAQKASASLPQQQGSDGKRFPILEMT